ncbi:amidohydrolase [Saccharibacillus kuerlensis]|uniref:Amidohydrolase YhaA n=1 Tax=Saccharibacillus kuerlensis TaxID=459527 RepID=A0ABQ2L7G3_9BACL|nr:amidohydrolase [Saccharibacillus kuerlensis]GGO06006.1 putative amidohydrolase YhaA [Saccharibacillus kuerlensis]
MEKWNARLAELEETMIEWRRHLHRNPEISFHETATAAFVAETLNGFGGIEVRTGVGGNGVVGTIRGAKPGRTIALRADFDALPIQDEKDVPYKSTAPGVMHACGHDGHTAALLAVAKVLSEHRDDLEGNVVLLHQHAEEAPPGGAKAMIEDGCLDGVDEVYGIHLASLQPYGTIGYKHGYLTASADLFEILIQGKGGHGASPHQTIDAVALGAQLITELQLLVSRRVDPIHPAVLTVGSFHAGSAHNVIADQAKMTGTVRTFQEEARDTIEQGIRALSEGLCGAFGASCEVAYMRGYPATFNHQKETDEFIRILSERQIGKLIELPAMMGGEDFSYYLQHKPGSFIMVGAGFDDRENFPHHHPKFDFDERALMVSARAFLALVDERLSAEYAPEEAEAASV